jgi:hypothetical protein
VGLGLAIVQRAFYSTAARCVRPMPNPG